MRRNNKEEQQQIQFFDYCRIMALQKPTLPFYSMTFHIPNERKCSIQRRIAMKRAGLKKGVPDIFVPVANTKYHGLFIEMKVKPNSASTEQKEMLQQLNGLGYLAVICWSGEEAIEVLEKYIANRL